MILITEGDVNIYYLQTLCLLFFPGETFSPDEVESEQTPVVSLSVKDTEEGIESTCTIRVGDRVRSSTHTEPLSAYPTREKCIKISSGIAIFEAGKRFLGFSPPWGILTGVRPVKLVADMVANGMDYASIRRRLTKEYFLNPKKASLAINICKFQNKILKKLPPDSCSLYISIPFCPSRCTYCSFVSYSTKKLFSLLPEYLDRLCLDIERTVKTINELGLKILTVYIGGGTPTVLDEAQLERVLKTVGENVDVASLREYSVEGGRPDTITPGKMRLMVENGVTRVSVNTQTLTDHVLADIGRHHTAEDYYRAFSIARDSGVKCINTDLIAGLPGETFTMFSRSVDGVIALKPENLTVHTFCVKRAAEILQTDSEIYHRSSGDAVKSVDYSQLKAKLADYTPYYMYRQKNTAGNLENVGFALDGHEGLYNIFIMEEVHSIFACGAGAVTKLVDRENKRIKRYFMPKYPYEYLKYSGDAEKSDAFYREMKDFYSAQNG
ncbi:MAG: coproporphyrinogen dehydrogenase HemZ [Ruminococcaceae bacterium]|nr:coproporphyrinogen dehydrogenase HemZ [Oscillospiraceae bacterium]